MEDDVVESLQEIFKVAQDETYTSAEALDVSRASAENVLQQYGHPVEAEADEE
jgi:hypothetical protein